MPGSQAAGEQIALVGGSVRDALLGRLRTTSTSPRRAPRRVTEKLVEGWADAVWEIGREFGTIGCRKGPWQVEITTYRAEAYDADSRKPDRVDYGDTLSDDLSRRDFTVNAMAVALPGNEFTDPYGGLDDLAHGVLRTPGRPRGVLRRRPAADAAGRPVRRAARLRGGARGASRR